MVNDTLERKLREGVEISSAKDRGEFLLVRLNPRGTFHRALIG